MKYYKVIIYSVFLFCFAACPKPQSEKDGETNLLINLIVMYNDGMFNPKGYFCEHTTGTITNGQTKNTNVGSGIKKFPGANGTSLELTLLDSSGCHIRWSLDYCDLFDNTFSVPNPSSGECGPGGTLNTNGEQIVCSIHPPPFHKYALNIIPEDSSHLYTNCSYSIKLTDL
ncbi:hypothetical protein [Leptospira wolffii]|uniref:hypothetical protein n=1 Tax=Leptospira wolffii TaxID=409998 RepID=UPI0014385552|nr:hypothetical protein [Leptospira wolffii]